MAEKVKEKAPIRKELKEKVKAAPKELLRRGLDDGTGRLRGQLRDTAQHGQQDGYGGDQIEDAAWRGAHLGERGIEKLLKKKKNGKNGPAPLEPPAKPPSGEGVPPKLPMGDGPVHAQIKTQETAVHGGHEDIPQDRVKSSRIRIETTGDVVIDTPDCASGTTPPGRSPERLSIKTKDSYTWRQPTEFPERPPQAMEQGRRKFQREQKEKAAAKRFGQHRTAPEAPPLSPAGGDKPSIQHSSPWRQIAQGGDAPVMTKGRADSPAASSRKAAVKVPGAGKKAVGRKAGQTVKTAKQGTKQALRSLDGVKAVGNTARVDLLRTVFWDMTKITAEEETVNHPANGSTQAWSETVLKITITPRTICGCSTASPTGRTRRWTPCWPTAECWRHWPAI